MKLSFTKMQGCANDYIYLDCRTSGVPEQIAALSERLSRRHFSIGADGIICICAPVTPGADGRMRIFNADGSEGENTFTITAKSEAGEQYTFKINVPYKLRGDGTVKIETNLTDGQKVMNGTNITLTVTAWSEKEDGTLIAQMTASSS